ncbi:hypothetical protein FRC12_001845 [Ceratobasidium sp. 428]|nr:hypothetical protein FRC12_001845 [Ceratobasidium sp. 428]
MPPARTESSIVSLPPRERALAKRCAKAMRLGISPSLVGKTSKTTKRKAKAPAPTLASTRKRRPGADFAYLNRPDGFHVKRVVRHPGTPERAPPVPYLPGQEDIPLSDTDSDTSDDDAPELTSAVGPGKPSQCFNVATEAGDTTVPTDPDLLDYDAEGEDDDEDICMEGIIYNNYVQSSTVNRRACGADTSMPGEQAEVGDGQAWASGCPTYSSQPLDLLANTSNEDVLALFGGLDELRLDNSFGGGPPNGMNDPSMWEPFAMGELSAAVNSLEASYSPRLPGYSANLLISCPLGIDQTTQPPATSLDRQHAPPSRVPTPAPWIIGARPQTPNLRPPSTPQHQPTPPPFIHSPAPRLSTPHAGPLRALETPSRACPRLSTSQRAAQARIQARSRHIPLPPPADSADQLLTRFPVERGTTSVLEPPPLRVSLDVPDFLRSDDEDGELDSENGHWS